MMSLQLTRSFHVNEMKVVKYFMTTRMKPSRDDSIPLDLEAKVEIDKFKELEAKVYGWFHHSKYSKKWLIKTFAPSSLSLSISLWLR